jgi:hypothetical protein
MPLEVLKAKIHKGYTFHSYKTLKPIKSRPLHVKTIKLTIL